MFNNRKVEKYLKYINDYDNLSKHFEIHQQQVKSYEYDLKSFKIQFDKELLISSKKLADITHSYFFKNGLLFSSNVLLDEINKNKLGDNNLNKKTRRLLISTLKYLTRSVTKTTPFSSFNNIFCLKNTSNYYTSDGINIKRSNLRITNLFFYYLKKNLIQEECFKNYLFIKSNTTIWDGSDNVANFHFFVNKDNDETFKKLNQSVILKYIKNQLSENDFTYYQLVNNLKGVTEEKKESIRIFIDTLIEEGFLKITYPVSCNDKIWIKKLLDFIVSDLPNSKNFKNLTITLENIQNIILKIESTFDISERTQYIKQCYQEVSDILTHYKDGKDFTNKILPQNLFYEDTFSEFNRDIPCEIVYDSSKILKQAFLTLNNIPYKSHLKKKMGKHLSKDFGGKLPILLFYQKIYLNYIDKFSFDEADLSTFQQGLENIFKSTNNCESSDDLDLSKIVNRGQDKFDILSFGCHIQVLNSQWDKIVLNSFSNGNGANISRFLNILPKKLVKKILHYNRDFHQNKILADIIDASIHNAGTYPPLTDYAFNLLDDNSLKERYHTIDLSNVFAVYDNKSGVVLQNKQGVEIIPNSFSLEGLSRRSKFTQFLDIFNHVDNSGFIMYKQNIRDFFKEKLLKLDVSCIPRLTFGEKIIIQRKTWLVNKKLFINFFSEGTQNIAEGFLLLNNWLVLNKIPNEVFIKIANKNSQNSQDDNYKPQYINFKSPIFILLFINLIRKADNVIEITEVCPAASQINENSGCVEEYVLNIS